MESQGSEGEKEQKSILEDIWMLMESQGFEGMEKSK